MGDRIISLIVLAVTCAGAAAGDILRAETTIGNSGTGSVVRFAIGDVGATEIEYLVESGPPMLQADGSVRFEAVDGPPFHPIPYSIRGQVCRGGECSALSAPLIVASAPPSRTAPLPQIGKPTIKSIAAGVAGLVVIQWKDPDHNADPTGVRVPVFEAMPQSATAWSAVPSTLVGPAPGVPSGNEFRSDVQAFDGCTDYRLRLVRALYQDSPPSDVVRFGTCVADPVPDPGVCRADLNGDGFVSGADFLILSAAFGAVCP